MLADRNDMVSEPASEGTGVHGCLHSESCLEGDRMEYCDWFHPVVSVPLARTDLWELSMYSRLFIIEVWFI